MRRERRVGQKKPPPGEAGVRCEKGTEAFLEEPSQNSDLTYPALPGFLCQNYVAVHYTVDLLLSQYNKQKNITIYKTIR